MQRVILCHSCNRTEPGGWSYCAYCHKELQAVIELYQQILRDYPAYRSLSIAQLFERLYNHAKSAHNALHGSKQG